MRSRLIYILKHNAAIQAIYKVVMSFVFRVWGCFVPVDERLILFSSFMGTGFNDSPRAMYDYIVSHPEYQKYRCVWAFADPQKYPGVESVTIDTPAYFRLALRAKYWCTNTNVERGLKFKKKNQV